ncbi:MAG: PDZ domain-containing protein [Planctomycetes bacterium]|nr:PDZ domain-containing protein [Planctomycetota bacterium]
MKMDLEKIYKSLKVGLFLSFLVLFLAGGCADEPQSTSDGPDDQKVLAQFKISKDGYPILLPVTFKDKEYLFLLDTGCSHTVFDTSFKHKLGNVKKVKRALTAGNRIVAELFDAPEAFLGPLNVKDCGEVACFDLKMLQSVIGRKVSGLIGMNFLKKHVVQIDFDKGTLSFLQPQEQQRSQWGNELPISYNPLGIPQITGNIYDSIKVDFWIDTGANSTGGLSSDIFDQILSEKELKTSEILFATASGVIRQREIRIDSLSVGSFKYQYLIFGEGNWSYLGLSFLSRHGVTLDFPNNRIYLKKGKGFKKDDETDMSGLHLLHISNKTVVYSVDEGSPAQKAGIKAKDIILKLNDKDANQYDISELRRLLMSRDGHKIMMTIKQGDDVKDVSFLLKKKI